MQTIINDLVKRVEILEAALLKTRTKRFEPPTLNEVYLYMLGKGCNNAQHEAEKFINFYGSNGWKVGKNKMVKWKFAASGWIAGKTNGSPAPTNKQQVLMALSPSEVNKTAW